MKGRTVENAELRQQLRSM